MLFGLIVFNASAQQEKPTPAITIMQARTGKAAVLKDNGSDGFYADIVDSAAAILFEYNFTAAQMNSIADDEYKEIVGFTVIPDKTGKFKLKGDALRAANGYLFKGCFCIDRGTAPIIDGSIKGTRMSKTTWYISLDVKISSRQGNATTITSKKLKGIFNIVPAE